LLFRAYNFWPSFRGIRVAETVILDEVPWSDQLTKYDRDHLKHYLRLLDARTDGANFDDMARIILGLDPDKDPDRALRSVRSHLRRAEWMTLQGYKELLKQ
jgi:hypothetical protein